MKKEKQLFFFLLPENLNFKFCYTGVSTGCAEMFRKIREICLSLSVCHHSQIPKFLEKDNRSYPS